MEARCKHYREKLVEPKTPTYATIIPDRYQQPVKLHMCIGQAKAAIAYTYWSGARGGELYQKTAEGWELLYRVERGTATADLPWKSK
jgi:hypothetical protein